MKTIGFIISLTLLLLTTYCFAADILIWAELQDILVKGMQITLLLMCVVGLIANWPDILRLRLRRFKMMRTPLA